LDGYNPDRETIRISATPATYVAMKVARRSLAIGTGFMMILLTMQLQCKQTRTARMARRLFKFSILYLFLLFAVLLIEKMLTGTAGRLAA
jgi:heme o synthase